MYIPQTGSFTIWFEGVSGVLLGRLFFEPPRKKLRMRWNNQARKNSPSIRNIMENIDFANPFDYMDPFS